jgi:Phage terminase, small subunit
MHDIALENAKHEHFCQLNANGESATQAYVLAGYSAKGAGPSAARLLKNAQICERIASLRAIKEAQHAESVRATIEKAGLSKAWVLEQLMENVAMAKAAEPVRDSEGNPTGEYKQNLGAANKALELLGSEIGMFIKKAEVGKPGEFADLTESELDRQLAETEKAIGGRAVH